PANVMVGAFGEVQVMDWGLAKVFGASRVENGELQQTADVSSVYTARSAASSGESALPETRVGQALGTPAYMSPEQAEGNIALISPATDVYTLGVILYEILTSRRPFQGINNGTTPPETTARINLPSQPEREVSGFSTRPRPPMRRATSP